MIANYMYSEVHNATLPRMPWETREVLPALFIKRSTDYFCRDEVCSEENMIIFII